MKLKSTIFMLASITFAALILTFPEAALSGASSALENWIKGVLPALLPFFMAASLLRTSGAAFRLSRMLSPITRRLGYHPSFAYALTVSLMTGFPAGASAVAAAYSEEDIPNENAARMLNAACNAGPLFMIGTVATGMLGDISAAKYILIPHYTSALLVIIINARFGKKNAADTYAPTAPPLSKTVGEQLHTAVSSAIESILIVLGFMIMYSVLTSVIHAIGLPSTVCMYAGGILEMATGSYGAAALPFRERIIFINAVLGFGGLSVHSQIFAIASRKGLRPRGFIFSRVIHGATAALISFLMLL